ncbi:MULTISPECIES: hypothetical protein [unclassified Bradyrhizobium]|uniref:hypothetical protein n=1 Tax=unclassified Bradyrhizobium TaxID=2631580 RepID=UPI00211DFA90|nr:MULTISPECIES: hypothetical protein [unclassified Bradyrhizobium]MDD1533049.1 hypothetical protein [Bradyrhizobium sp. WBOS8]MDD1582703.1 hypothetical protein [Bradyrhizobium sp. WBOS4]UUO48427.1 hypothetical protein DCM78_16835 [Bradyrhizobium sp. WBOS04]UUO62049.1 hypothetical protein DCM80_24580 [Bradyrhizobium sp. WBOS08]
MRLAANTFSLQLGDRSFDLKPSLRAAFILYERYDGFHNLSRQLADGSLTAALDIISATIVNAKAWGEYALPTNGAVIRDLLAATGDLIDFVMLLAGADDKASDKPQTGEPIPFDDYFTQLFQIGTGWLGWTPDGTWEATASEIINAQRGRMDLLRALFGSKEQTAEPSDLGSIKADLNAIGDLTVHSLGAR